MQKLTLMDLAFGFVAAVILAAIGACTFLITVAISCRVGGPCLGVP